MNDLENTDCAIVVDAETYGPERQPRVGQLRTEKKIREGSFNAMERSYWFSNRYNRLQDDTETQKYKAIFFDDLLETMEHPF
jgi:hypothetical protein